MLFQQFLLKATQNAAASVIILVREEQAPPVRTALPKSISIWVQFLKPY